MSTTGQPSSRPSIAWAAMSIVGVGVAIGCFAVWIAARVLEPGTSPALPVVASLAGLGVVAVIARSLARSFAREVETASMLVDVLASASDPSSALATANAARRDTHEVESPLLREIGVVSARIAARLERSTRDANLALAAATQEKSGKMQFFATMSHDLRGPLASIIGFSDLLDLDASVTPEQRQSIRQIRAAATALLALVDDLLDAARLEAGRIALRPRWTPVVELWTDARTVAATPAQQTHQVRVEVEMEPGLPPAWVDPARSRHALSLLVGALIRSLKLGKLVLRATHVRDVDALPASVRARGAPTRFVRIDLDDRGAARDAATHAQILALLAAALDGNKPEGSLGLRLSLAVALVEMQGGWAACRSRDDGSHVVSIALPLEAS